MPNNKKRHGAQARGQGKRRKTISTREEQPQKQATRTTTRTTTRRETRKPTKEIEELEANIGPVDHSSSESGSELNFPILEGEVLPRPFSQEVQVDDYIPSPELSFWDPVGGNVPQKIKEKIWAGQFIDLSILLKSEREVHRDQELSGELKVRNNRMVLEPNTKLGNYLDIEDWTSAFLVFMSVMLEKYRTRSQELLKYMRDIRLASKRSDKRGWGTYDEQYRLRKQRDPHSSWGIINQEYWLLYVTRDNNSIHQQVNQKAYISPSTNVHVYPQSKQGQNPQSMSLTNQPMGRPSTTNLPHINKAIKTNTQYCRFYNQGFDCQFFPRCRYLHQCETCGGKHRRIHCRSANRTGQVKH